MPSLVNIKLDKAFDDHVSEPFQKPSELHWTPAKIAVKTAKWLGETENTKVLDIGSGIGKFCIVGAQSSDSLFVGIELRASLVEEALKIVKKLKTPNVSFLNENIASVSFDDFDAFYFYNPFVEHLAIADWVDKTIGFSESKFNEFEKYVFQQLAKKPKGTRVATYCSPNFFLPDSYFAKEILNDGALVFWEKML